MAKKFVVIPDDHCPYCTPAERKQYVPHGIAGRKACKDRHDHAEAARRAAAKAKPSSKKGGRK